MEILRINIFSLSLFLNFFMFRIFSLSFDILSDVDENISKYLLEMRVGLGGVQREALGVASSAHRAVE